MTDITVDGMPVKSLDIHFAGDDGEYLWFDFITEDGQKKESSYYFKGTV